MQIVASTVDEYIAQLPEARAAAFNRLREVIKGALPDGFDEQLSYGMVGFVVPHSIYPDGYHCKPEAPLPFTSIGNQKHFIGLYHSGIYADKAVHDWFVEQYSTVCKTKLDMGKSCVRFKKMDDIPYELIAELMSKITVQQWIALYESRNKRSAGC